MKFLFTLLLSLILLPFKGMSQTEVYNITDIEVLKKIANDNPQFIHREDWLSETPEWKGVKWSNDDTNKRVLELKILKSQCKTIDISNLKEIQHFDCSTNSQNLSDVLLTELIANDLSNLTNLNARFQAISSININNTVQLKTLVLDHNQLKTIDLSTNSNLTDIDISYNLLDQVNIASSYHTTPTMNLSYNKFPFSALHLLNNSFQLISRIEQEKLFDPVVYSGTVDYSSEKEIAGNKTSYEWYFSDNNKVPAGNITEISEGVFKINQLAGNFYCKMSNDLFPDLQLISSNITIKAQTKNQSEIENLHQLAQANPDFIYRDDWLSATPEWKGVTWGGDPNNAKVYEIDLKNSCLTNADFTSFKELRKIAVNSNDSWLEGTSTSKIKNLYITGLSKLMELSCSYNQLSTLDFTGVTQLQKLDCRYNNFESLQINQLSKLKVLNCSTNQLTHLDISNNPDLTELNCNKNSFTFTALLPLKGIDQFNAHSQTIFLETNFESTVDYSTEANLNGTPTSFNWYHANGNSVPSEDMEVLSPGIFKFKKFGEYYCKMENKHFYDVQLTTRTVTITGKKNADDLIVLQKIANDNPDFIYKEDWLSANPKWYGVTWGGEIDNSRVLQINIANSNLSELDISTLSELERIFLPNKPEFKAKSRINSINISGLSKLSYVNVDNNNISTIDFKNCNQLELIYIGKNQLSEVNIQNLEKLKFLECNYNQISDILTQNNPALTSVNCRSNKLTFNKLLPLKDIVNLDYQYQAIDFPEISSVETIDLLQYLTSDSKVEWYQFNDELKLGHEETEESSTGIFRFKFTGEYYALLSDPAFPELTLKTNKISITGKENSNDVAVLQEMARQNLNFIYRSDWLADIPNWKGIVWSKVCMNKRVEKIEILNSLLTTVDARTLNELHTLSLVNNYEVSMDHKIENINVTGLSDLKYLNVDNNNIDNIDLSTCKKLEELLIQKNQLTELNIEELEVLKTLNCELNQIKQISSKNNHQLTNLNCQNNQLTFVKLFPLKDISNLKYEYQIVDIKEINTIKKVDLSEYVTNIGNVEWFYYYKETKLEDEKIEQLSSQIFNFKNIDEYYAILTDPSFPDLNFKTKKVTITGAKNSNDVSVLKEIANSNPNFIYRDDWLSASPIWKGITWDDDKVDNRVVEINIQNSGLSNVNLSPLNDIHTILLENDLNTNVEFKINTLQVEGLSNLKTITINNNNISDIDFTGCHALKEVLCNKNELEKLNISNLSNLTNLDCSFNKISQIVIENNTSLSTLICKNNHLNFKHLSPLKHFTNLDYENQELQLEEIITPKTVDLSACIDLSTTEIEWFDKEGTKIDGSSYTINSAGIYTFHIIGEYYAILRDASFPKQTFTTKSVSVTGIKNINDIAALRKIAENNSNFTFRSDWLSENPEWEGVKWNHFTDNCSVIELTLPNQNLETIDISPFKELIRFDIGFFSMTKVHELQIGKLEKLEYLNCKGQTISNLDASLLKNLNYLDCSSNNITKLLVPDIGSKLKTLICSKNKLTSLHLGHLNLLEKINCEENNIVSLQVSNSDSKLESLNCSKNEITSLLLEKQGKLRSLNCSENTLSEIHLPEESSLKTCICNSNLLEEIELSKQKELTSLNCSHNQINSIHSENLDHLESLDCSSNKINELILPNSKKLSSLTCGDNYLLLKEFASFNKFDFDHFSYSPQHTFTVDPVKDNLLDLRLENTVNGTNTEFTFYQNSTVCNHLVDEQENGLFVFKSTGIFTCKMYNNSLPDLTVRSEPFEIKNKNENYELNSKFTYTSNFTGLTREKAVGFAIGKKGYIGFGSNKTLLNDFWEFDSDRKEWTQRQTPPLPERENAIGFSVNGKGYIGLGTNGKNRLTDLWQYTPETDKWKKVSSYPGSNIDSFTWVLHNEKVYFFCGTNNTGAYSNEVWVYEPNNNRWEQKGDFPGNQRVGAIAYSLNGQIYFGSGYDYSSGSIATNDFWAYDSEKDSWTDTKIIITKAISSPNYFSIHDKGYFGLVGKSPYLIEYNPQTEIFSETTYPFQNKEINLNDATTFVIEDKVYICLGAHEQEASDKIMNANIIAFTPPVEPLQKVENLKAELVSDYKVCLTWEDMSANETAYEIMCSTDQLTFNSIQKLESNQESFTTNDLLAETVYYFKIKTIGNRDTAKESDIVEISTLAEPVKSPTNLQLNLVGFTKVKLSWTDCSRAETKQIIQFSLDNKNWKEYATIDANLTNYQTQKLEPETTYFFKVMAQDQENNTKESEIRSIVTSSDFIKAPSNLELEIVEFLKVRLNWMDNSRAEINQKILLSKDNVNWEIYTTVDPDITIYETQKLAPKTNYHFKVVACDENGSEKESGIVAIITHASPLIAADDIFGSVINHTDVNLEWKNNSLIEVQQEILISTDNKTFTVHSQVNDNVTSIQIENLNPATVYYFKIRSVASDNESIESEVLTVTTDQVTGINNIKNAELKIYPNPATEYVKVQLSKEFNSTIYLMDKNGRIIQTKEGKGEIQFNVQSNSSGMYFIKIENEDGCRTEKLMIFKK